MSFELLLQKLNGAALLAKALPADDDKGDEKKIEAAAADGEGDGESDDNGDGEVQADGDGAEGEGKPMAKSFLLELEDGTKMEAFDGTELLKSLTTRLEVSETALKTNEEMVLKSLNVAVDLIAAQGTQMAEQGVLIKSLQSKVAELAKSGRGRISTLAVTEKPQLETTLTKSQQPTMGRDEFLGKALGAMKVGRITGLEASGIETCLNDGRAIDPQLISRVLSN